MARVLSGIQPSGEVHLGNHLGAIRRWVDEQRAEHHFCIVDLHAMTVAYQPEQLREATLEMAAWLLAAGLDPQRCTLFVQSHVREHSELAWVLTCITGIGELQRMTQFKEKAAAQELIGAGLLTYPVLQAADILLYHAEEVPVGEDQRQHLELTRDLAERFNHRFGELLTVPRATFPPAAARVMDLQHPERKMSKSADSPAGTIRLADDERTTERKIMRAVTDSGDEIRADEAKPGVRNLLEILSAASGEPVADLERRLAGSGYGALKREVAEAVNELLRPIRRRHDELRDDPAEIRRALEVGAERARSVAQGTMDGVREAVGQLV